jgi:hypothetical protein
MSTKYFHPISHPVVASAEPGEQWVWWYGNNTNKYLFYLFYMLNVDYAFSFSGLTSISLR